MTDQMNVMMKLKTSPTKMPVNSPIPRGTIPMKRKLNFQHFVLKNKEKMSVSLQAANYDTDINTLYAKLSEDFNKRKTDVLEQSNSTLQQNDDSGVGPGRPRTLSSKEEFIPVMCRLRQGFAECHLGYLYNISQSIVSRIIISWVNIMYLRFGKLNIWPSRKCVDDNMPQDFKKKYPNTRAIIDCTEIKCQMPSSLLLNSELFSSYKNPTTLKGLIAISPAGHISFLSQLYTGSIADREITERSGFLDIPFDANDSVMADIGFTIQDLLPVGLSLNIPHF